MKFDAAAFDYDRTLTDESLEISEKTAASLKHLRDAGIKTLVVSGRVLEFLDGVNSKFDIADAIVAENGAIVYFPQTQKKLILGEENSMKIKAAFRDSPEGFFFGEAIVATTIEHLDEARTILQDDGISDLADIELNRRDVMIMPKSVNKETGLAEALRMLGIKKENAACIGDAENDLALFRACGHKAAVANAVDALKKKADFICSKPYGEGVQEFAEFILKGV